MKQSEIIFRIGRIVRAVEARTGLDQIDRSSRAILHFIGEAETVGKAPSSTMIVNGAGVGTAPTIYARLTELEELGWIQALDDREDGRVKRMCLTTKARRAFAQMSAEIEKQRVFFAP